MDYTAFLTPAIGATGLLALVVLMILRGALVPRSTLDSMRADKDEQIRAWKEMYYRGAEVQEAQREQVLKLLDAARTTTQVLRALPEAAGANSERGHHDLASKED